jgi:hypothetical protein
MQVSRANGPKARFMSFVPLEMTPRAASRDAGGSLPIRAVRYCEAVTSACSFGWWLYPPLDAWLLWDGHTVFFSFDGEEFAPLDDSCEFPGMAEALDEHAPEGIDPVACPLFTALPEPGLMQVSLGVIANTAPGWSLLLRRPVNLPLFGGYDTLEGIVETDTWRGPLFVNIRLTRTHTPVRLHARAPLVQAQPIPHWVYHQDTMADLRVSGISEMTADDWRAWDRTFVEPSSRPARKNGEYAVSVRKRQRGGGCPFAQAETA